MDILGLLQKRTEYAFGSREKDKWLEEELKSDKDEILIVSTESCMNRTQINFELLDKLCLDYSLKAMFDLKNPLYGTSISFNLYVFSKEKNNSVLYGIYKQPLRVRKKGNAREISLADEYPETYFDYLENIEVFLQNGECPEDTQFGEYGVIDSSLIEYNCWNPNRYNKAALKLRKVLEKEKTISLQDVATIRKPRPDVDKKHTSNVAHPVMWSYPVDYTKLRDGVLTDYPLKKGDIVIHDDERMFYVYEDTEMEIHTSPNFYVVRPHSICPEYLYLYLCSETAKVVMSSMSSGAVIRRISQRDLREFQIISPDKEDDYYIKLFYAEKFPVKDIAEINKVIMSLSPEDEKDTTAGDILNLEYIQDLRMYKADVMEKMLEEDMKELNICFKHKAYKATLILAGSILEAVLIDWLSELHGKDYFNEDYIDHRGRKGTLAIYIQDIKYLKRPDWLVEAGKADEIRLKRNKVHAKLCVNTEDINEDLCREVVGYLEDVLRTRNGQVRRR